MSYGTDFDAFDDITRDWAIATETHGVAQAVARRYITPRGGNPWDPAYGYSLVLLVSSSASPANAEIDIAAEARKDERVAQCVVSITVIGDSWEVLINCTLLDGGTFSLTLLVSKLTVELLKVGT